MDVDCFVVIGRDPKDGHRYSFAALPQIGDVILVLWEHAPKGYCVVTQRGISAERVTLFVDLLPDDHPLAHAPPFR